MSRWFRAPRCRPQLAADAGLAADWCAGLAHGEVRVGARRRWVPSAWDDLTVRASRCWKRHRGAQWLKRNERKRR